MGEIWLTRTAAVAAPWEIPESRQLMLLDSCTLRTVTVVFPYTKHITSYGVFSWKMTEPCGPQSGLSYNAGDNMPKHMHQDTRSDSQSTSPSVTTDQRLIWLS